MPQGLACVILSPVMRILLFCVGKPWCRGLATSCPELFKSVSFFKGIRIPAKIQRLPKVHLMLVPRLRRWPNITFTLVLPNINFMLKIDFGYTQWKFDVRPPFTTLSEHRTSCFCRDFWAFPENTTYRSNVGPPFTALAQHWPTCVVFASLAHIHFPTSPSWYIMSNPSNTRNRPNVGSMLGHRLRRWPNIGPALGPCLVIDGNHWALRDFDVTCMCEG